MVNKILLVSIVIPTYNRKKSLERLIKSIFRSSYKKIEIIIVDDASQDNTAEYIKSRFPSNKAIKLIRHKKNQFAAAAKNTGQKMALGEFILFIDDDNTVDKEMIRELVNVFLEDDNIGEAGPINYNFNSKKLTLLTRSTRNMWTTKTLHLRSFSLFRSKKYWEADDIPNAFMIRSAIVLKKRIRFKPGFGIMYEESDYAYRIRRAGYKVVMVRKAHVFHDIEDSSKKRIKKDYMYHFMEDKRRPFVFARNRIIFHQLYSTKLQNVMILTFWVWFFLIYYSYKFMLYSGYGKFNLIQRLSSVFSYLRGTLAGYKFVLLKENL